MLIRVVSHDPRWASSFDAEARRIDAALSEVVIRLHHIGSTAIPGIKAKPVIDILMEVSDLTELDRRTPQAESLGYEAKGEFGIPGRRYFRRDDAAGFRTHQIHAFLASSGEAERHLAFRDYMIAHPQIAQVYGVEDERARIQAALGNPRRGRSDFSGVRPLSLLAATPCRRTFATASQTPLRGLPR